MKCKSVVNNFAIYYAPMDAATMPNPTKNSVLFRPVFIPS